MLTSFSSILYYKTTLVGDAGYGAQVAAFRGYWQLYGRVNGLHALSHLFIFSSLTQNDPSAQ
jgi:hypothetical protein